MSNSRIKPIPGLPGANMEAIAATIVIDYNPADPGKSRINFAFQNFITDGEGNVIADFADNKYDPIPCDLAALMGIDTGVPGVDMIAIVAAIKGISDAVHNARAQRDAEGQVQP